MSASGPSGSLVLRWLGISRNKTFLRLVMSHHTVTVWPLSVAKVRNLIIILTLFLPFATIIIHLDHFASWVTSDIWLAPFKSRTAVVTELIVKNSKKLNF